MESKRPLVSMKKIFLTLFFICFFGFVPEAFATDGVPMHDWFTDLPHNVPWVAPNGQTYTYIIQTRAVSSLGDSQRLLYCNSNSTFYLENYASANSAIRLHYENCYRSIKYPPTSQPTWEDMEFIASSLYAPNAGSDANDDLLITDFFRSNVDIYFSPTTSWDYSVGGTHSYWGLGNTSTNQLIISSSSFNGGPPLPLDSTIFNGAFYSLSVVSPQLDSNYHADVQPSTAFKIKLRYVVPADNYDTTEFLFWQCDSFELDPQGCSLLGNGTIESIRENLPDTENQDGSGFIYMEAPVVLNEYTVLLSQIVDTVSRSSIMITPLSLKGVADSSLPSENSALLNNGAVQDLGFWGNLFRDLFVPSPDFINTQITTFVSYRDTKFPAYAQIKNTLTTAESGLIGGATTIPVLTISLFGADNMQIMDTTVLNPYIVQFKGWVSMFLWFFCAIFCIKAIHAYFHPGQIKMNI